MQLGDKLRLQPSSWLSQGKDLWNKEKGEPKSIILMAMRLLTGLFTIIATIAILVPQSEKDNDNMAVVILDTSTMDIFAGLYETVGDTFNSNGDLSFGEGLSTSQIIALTNLTTSMLYDTPDYIASGIFNMCLHYTYRWKYYDDGPHRSIAPNDTNAFRVSPMDDLPYDTTTQETVCQDATLYDYRAILIDDFAVLGTIMVSKSVFDTKNRDDDIADDASNYLKWREPRENLLHAVPGLLSFVAVLQVPMLIMMAIYYKFKRANIHPKTVKMLGNALAISSIIAAILMSFTAISTIVVIGDFKSRIHSELSRYKISLHMGQSWFALMYSISISCILSMACWTMPIWCATPDDYDEAENIALGNDDSDMLFTTYSYGNETFDDRTFQMPSMSTSGLKKSFMYNDENYSRSLLDQTDALIDVPFKERT